MHPFVESKQKRRENIENEMLRQKVWRKQTNRCYWWTHWSIHRNDWRSM